MKLLSVVIITCNREETIIATIESCNNNINMNWELIVVENNSKDQTERKVKKFCEANDIQLEYIKNKTNLGVAGARVQGYNQARGEIVYFIDDDAVVLGKGNCIDEAYEYLLNSDEVQALSNKIDDTLYGGILPEIVEYDGKMKNGVDLRSFIGCSHFLKKGNVLPEPLYPLNLFYGAEEIYLSYYIHAAGKRIEYYDKINILHTPSPNARTSEYEKELNKQLNWYIVKKYIYPKKYFIVTHILFVIRMIKLTKFNIKKLLGVYKVFKNRYDEKYIKRISNKSMKNIWHKFNWRYLI